MTAPSIADADRLYQFLVEYITSRRYGPSADEIRRSIHRDSRQTGELLALLEQQGRIRVLPWKGGKGRTIVLAGAAHSPSLPAGGKPGPAPILGRPSPVTVDRAIDWKRLLKDFRGVAVAKLTAGQIARYYRKRCHEADPRQAEREANVLLCLRFPEVFLERRQKLDLSGFDDRQRPKRGCRSCGAKFRKLRPNQLYCSARCRTREKRHRRQATSRGKLLRSQQNERYRLKHEERERERRRQWRLNHPREYRAQKDRELARRSLRTGWNQRRDWHLPASVAAIAMTFKPGATPLSRLESYRGVPLSPMFSAPKRT